MESAILTVKQVAPLRQYHAAYAGGHAYVWKVMFGLMALWLGRRGFGVEREEQDSERRRKAVKFLLWLLG